MGGVHKVAIGSGAINDVPEPCPRDPMQRLPGQRAWTYPPAHQGMLPVRAMRDLLSPLRHPPRPVHGLAVV